VRVLREADCGLVCAHGLAEVAEVLLDRFGRVSELAVGDAIEVYDVESKHAQKCRCMKASGAVDAVQHDLRAAGRFEGNFARLHDGGGVSLAGARVRLNGSERAARANLPPAAFAADRGDFAGLRRVGGDAEVIEELESVPLLGIVA